MAVFRNVPPAQYNNTNAPSSTRNAKRRTSGRERGKRAHPQPFAIKWPSVGFSHHLNRRPPARSSVSRSVLPVMLDTIFCFRNQLGGFIEVTTRPNSLLSTLLSPVQVTGMPRRSRGRTPRVPNPIVSVFFSVLCAAFVYHSTST